MLRQQRRKKWQAGWQRPTGQVRRERPWWRKTGMCCCFE